MAPSMACPPWWLLYRLASMHGGGVAQQILRGMSGDAMPAAPGCDLHTGRDHAVSKEATHTRLEIGARVDHAISATHFGPGRDPGAAAAHGVPASGHRAKLDGIDAVAQDATALHRRRRLDDGL